MSFFLLLATYTLKVVVIALDRINPQPDPIPRLHPDPMADLVAELAEDDEQLVARLREDQEVEWLWSLYDMPTYDRSRQ